MVLQRSKAVPIWGKAASGEQVTVSFNGQSVNATADSSGAWKASLAPMPAGGPYVMDIKGANSVSIQDVYVGEVWLASGQSNMHHIVSTALNADKEIASANIPLIRMFTANPQVAKTPQDDVAGAWQVASPQTVAEFLRCRLFLRPRALTRNSTSPSASSTASFDWTPGESWVSREALSSDPELKQDILGKWDDIDSTYPAKKARYDADMKAWQAAGSKGTPPMGPRGPHVLPPRRRPLEWRRRPRSSPTAFAASSGGRAKPTQTVSVATSIVALFQALITDWRKNWNDQSLPFFWVQLSSVLPADPQPVESEWAEVREAQAMALALPATGMAVGIDLGEPPKERPSP
jgi:sialate O-acetylesterase